MVKKIRGTKKQESDSLDLAPQLEKQSTTNFFRKEELAVITEPGGTSDIVCDILAIVRSKAEIDNESLQQIDEQIRERWGGDRVWISKKAGAGMSYRNDAIKRDYWQRGERISLLARRYQISTRRIWEILKS